MFLIDQGARAKIKYRFFVFCEALKNDKYDNWLYH